MLTIFKILDHDDYWLALQKPGDVPNLFLFTYRHESPRWDILPIIRGLMQHILPDQKIRTTTRELTATPVKRSETSVSLRPGDNESDFLKCALKHCPDFLRDFSGSDEGPKAKLEFIA